MNKETTKIIKAQVLTKEVILEFSTQESLKILLNTSVISSSVSVLSLALKVTEYATLFLPSGICAPL